jgi:hypothetical protein
MALQGDRLRGGPLQETEIMMPPSSQEDRVLSRLNQNFRMSIESSLSLFFKISIRGNNKVV